MDNIYTLKTPLVIGSETITEIELQAPKARGKDIASACSKMAGFVLGAENRAQLETVKAVQGIDFGAVQGKAEATEPTPTELARQMIARCCMVDGDFTSELIERFTAVHTRSPNVLTYLNMPLAKDAFEQIDWRDLETIAGVYAINFMLS